MSTQPTEEGPSSGWSRLPGRLAEANAWLVQLLGRYAPSEQSRTYVVTIGLGLVCGVLAVLFHFAIRMTSHVLIDRALAAPEGWVVLWTLLVPTLGGLLVGILLERVPRVRGSGVPQVKAAYSIRSGRLRARDAVARFVVSAIQLGSGASLGREGPTVHMCAAAGSVVARLFALSPTNVRRMIPVGAAAGIAAAFNAPIAAVTFVIEELVGALDTTVLSGVVIAAAIAAVVEHELLGGHPIFDVPPTYHFEHAASLLTFALLGVAAAFVGRAFSGGLLRLRRAFLDWKQVPRWAHPAVGGAVTGALAVVALIFFRARGIAGGGYEALTAALNGQLGLRLLLVLGVLKLGSTVFSYASGGAGGIFAPVLFVGGMLGGGFGYLDQWMFDHTGAEVGAFAAVGMGAVFAAVIRAPITSVLLMFEMTGGYGLVLPLMVANMVSFIISRRLSEQPIYDALLEQDGIHLPSSKALRPALSALRVADAMTRHPVTLSASSTLDEAWTQIQALPYASYPVLDGAGRLVGVLSVGRLRRARAGQRGHDRVEDHARTRAYVRSSRSLREAMEAMGSLGVRQMMVVAEDGPSKLVGVLAMSDVVRALLREEDSSGAPFPPSDMTSPSLPSIQV